MQCHGMTYPKKIFFSQTKSQEELEFDDLVKNLELFLAVRQALITLLTVPTTTCTVERSFSAMIRVKTWLKSTMCDDRLSGLCMMSVHRN